MNVGIFASERKDPVLKNLTLWLKRLGSRVEIIFKNELFESFEIQLTSFQNYFDCVLSTKSGKTIEFQSFDVFFMRQDLSIQTSGSNNLETFRINEYNAFLQFLFFELQKSNKLIGYCSKELSNKLIQLSLARTCGLDVPDFVITNHSKNITNKFASKQVVNKAIQSAYFEKTDSSIKTNFTQLVDIDEIPNKLDLALLQCYVNKKLELRIFVFFEEVFCVAASSSELNKIVDIRQLMAGNLIDYYKYSIPKAISSALIKLRKRMNLHMYSVDVIVTKDNKYQVLDINPFGQISMVAQTCYPEIEELIARKIISYGK